MDEWKLSAAALDRSTGINAAGGVPRAMERQERKRREQETTVPGIPVWSSTAVPTGRYAALIPYNLVTIGMWQSHCAMWLGDFAMAE